MNIVEKNIGEKINYSVDGTKININDQLTLDLAKCERDFDVHIDISENWAGIMVTGLADRYVAQIDIPARKYNEIKKEGTEDEEDSIILEPVPFSMDRVTLTLWSIEGGNR